MVRDQGSSVIFLLFALPSAYFLWQRENSLFSGAIMYFEIMNTLQLKASMKV